MMNFDVLEEDVIKAKERYIENISPLKLKIFPSKEKQKYILLRFIVKLFDKDKKYSEKEINEILKPVYEDYVMLRRYLVDYQYLDRLDNGQVYWVK